MQSRVAGSRPDEQGPLQDDGGHVGGRSISWQDGPQEEHRSQVVDIGGRLVGAHLQRHPSLSDLSVSRIGFICHSRNGRQIERHRQAGAPVGLPQSTGS